MSDARAEDAHGVGAASGPASLESILDEARSRGYLAGGGHEAHVEHAEGFVEVVHELFPPTVERGAGATGPAGPAGRLGTARLRVLDLGAGGGIPGLVIASRLPLAAVWLLEGSTSRAAWLRSAIAALGLQGSTDVVPQRAEVAARAAAYRGSFDVVTARSFGGPAVTAECAAGFLRPGGWLIVSEPPPRPGVVRWSTDGLGRLGMGEPRFERRRGFGFACIPCVATCDERFPRRTGIPEKRPLF